MRLTLGVTMHWLSGHADSTYGKPDIQPYRLEHMQSVQVYCVRNYFSGNATSNPQSLYSQVPVGITVTVGKAVDQIGLIPAPPQ